MLIDDLQECYKQTTEINRPVVPEALHKLVDTRMGIAEEQRQYWQSNFPLPVSPSMFPCKNPTKLSVSGRSTSRVSHFSVNSLKCVRNLEVTARRLSVSLNSVLLASWAQVQSAETRSSSAIFGMWHIGRSAPIAGMETLAFPCFNILPLKIDVGTGDGILDISRQVQARLKSRTFIVEQSNLEDVDRWLEGGGKPLCNTFINILRSDGPTLHGSNAILEAVHIPYEPLGNVPQPQSPQRGRLSSGDLIQVSVA